MTEGIIEECVLRFFAFLDQYKKFDHSVTDFLNGFMKNASNHFDFAIREREFRTVFRELAEAFPRGIIRPGRKGRTPLNLYECVAVGAALAIRKMANWIFIIWRIGWLQIICVNIQQVRQMTAAQ
jgi:hypothetical protein